MDKFLESASYVFDNQLASIILLSYLIFATYTDIKHMKIYDKFNLSLVVVRILFLFIPLFKVEFRVENIIASLSVFIVLLLFGMIFMHKMGGDIKFLSAFMLFFDFNFMILFMAVSSILNLIYFILVKFYINKKNRSNAESLKSRFICLLTNLTVSPEDEVLKMINAANSSEFKKYKAPFAPFFLISYIILWITYFILK